MFLQPLESFADAIAGDTTADWIQLRDQLMHLCSQTEQAAGGDVGERLHVFMLANDVAEISSWDRSVIVGQPNSHPASDRLEISVVFQRPLINTAALARCNEAMEW